MAMPKQYDVFISYSRKDTAIADKICKALDKAGITYFIDRQGIKGGMEFPVVLANAILEAKLFLYLASENSYASKFTNSEITFAFNKKPSNSLLPYIIDGSNMPVQMEFIFSGINWRTIENHPIETTLVNDLLNLLGKRDGNIQIQDSISTEIFTVEDSDLEAYQDTKGLFGYRHVKTKEVIIPCKWVKAESFKEGLALVKGDNYKCGFIDKRGDLVIPCVWGNAFLFSDGLARVVDKDSNIGYIDKSGKIVISCQWKGASGFSEGLASVKDSQGKYGYIDKAGKLVVPLIWESAWSFSEGLANVRNDNGKWGYIDKAGVLVIPCSWRNAHPFYDGLALVSDESISGNYGYVNKDGFLAIAKKWKRASYFKNGVAYVKDENDKFHKIDKTGKVIEADIPDPKVFLF